VETKQLRPPRTLHTEERSTVQQSLHKLNVILSGHHRLEAAAAAAAAFVSMCCFRISTRHNRAALEFISR